MSPEAQRIAIAEALGLKLFQDGRTVHGALWASRDGKNWFYTKDWFSDLNAVHETEKMLTNQQAMHWGQLLEQIVERDRNEHIITCLTAHATATQRAEAFLRTLNLWDDSL